MLLKLRRDTVRWSEWVPGEPSRLVMVDGDISIDWRTNLLLPGLLDAFGPGEKITLATAVFSFRKEPLLALNATTGELVGPVRWLVSVAILLPALLLLFPLLMGGSIGAAIGIILVALAVAVAHDIALRSTAARLLANCAQEAAHPRTPLVTPSPRIEITVMEGPEPDWDQIMLDRWNGDLGGNYRQDLGLLALPEGRVLVGEPGYLDRAEVVAVRPGLHPVWLAVARMEADERVSHAFLALGTGKATRVVPVLAADGSAIEIGVDGGMAAFASANAAASLAAANGGDIEQDYLIVKAMMEDRRDWIRFAVPGSADVVTAFDSGYGDGIYPLVTLLNDRDEVLAVAIDFLIW
jgi:hypothetical protein